MSDLKKQADIVKQRLEYHFRGTDGTWIYPSNLPFMKEFLNEVDKMCTQANDLKTSASGLHLQNVNNNEVAVCCDTCKHLLNYAKNTPCDTCFTDCENWEQQTDC